MHNCICRVGLKIMTSATQENNLVFLQFDFFQIEFEFNCCLEISGESLVISR